MFLDILFLSWKQFVNVGSIAKHHEGKTVLTHTTCSDTIKASVPLTQHLPFDLAGKIAEAYLKLTYAKIPAGKRIVCETDNCHPHFSHLS